MQVKIKRIDNTLPLPQYHTAGSCAFDIYARTEIEIPPRQFRRVPTNLIIQVPNGYTLYISLRSSTPEKKQLICGNAPGIIDRDYCGPEDEIKIIVYNLSETPVTIARGERFAQGIFVKSENAAFQETDEIKPDSRGGFGSTG
jgi:dUTP pyrophosphatase